MMPCAASLFALVLELVQQFGNLGPHRVELHVAEFVVADWRAAGRVEIQRDARLPFARDFLRVDCDHSHS
jgi:hypothetical protein